jgi:hypothetical protein
MVLLITLLLVVVVISQVPLQVKQVLAVAVALPIHQAQAVQALKQAVVVVELLIT